MRHEVEELDILACKKCGAKTTIPYGEHHMDWLICPDCGNQGFTKVGTQRVEFPQVENVRMRISKKQWEKIKDYVRDHVDEIWEMVWNTTKNGNNAIVWLDGVENEEYRLRVSSENPATTTNSLQVYWLPKNWKNAFYSFDDEEYEDYPDDVYEEEGKHDFQCDLDTRLFWDEVKYNNGIEVVE